MPEIEEEGGIDIDRFEIKFKRFLGKCENQSKAHSLTNLQALKYKKYLETLENQFQTLESNHLAPDSKRSYERRIQSLRNWFQRTINQQPNNQENNNKNNEQQQNNIVEKESKNSTTNKKSNEKTDLLASWFKEEQAQMERKQLLFGNKNKKEEEEFTGMNKNENLTEEGLIDEKINRNHKAQEQLTEEMAGLAKQMKENSLNIYNTLKSESGNLDKLSKLADKNVENVTHERKRIDKKLNENFFSTISMLLTMVFALLTVLFVYLFVIKPF